MLETSQQDSSSSTNEPPPSNPLKKQEQSLGFDPYKDLHKSLILRESRLGKGLYATAPIRAGELIYKPSHHDPSPTTAKVSAAEMANWTPKQLAFYDKYAWQVGPDLFVGPTCKDAIKKDYNYFLNHSCDPTTWFQGEEVLIARRDISVGEELTFDYGSSETQPSVCMVKGCLCGSQICRKRISPWDYRLPSLRQRYGDHFMPYILEKMASEPKVEFGTGMYFGLNKDIELKESPTHGYGLFAKALIPKGALVWCGEGDEDVVVDWETVKTFSEEKKAWFLPTCFQVDDDKVSGLRAPEYFWKDAAHAMNHSCDPNCWYIGDRLMEARRDILPGEEITYDYGTADSLFERITECKCGTDKCRGRVRPKDYLLPELQARYRNHFALHILAKIYYTWDMLNQDGS